MEEVKEKLLPGELGVSPGVIIRLDRMIQKPGFSDQVRE